MPKVKDKQGGTATVRWKKVTSIVSAYAYMRAFTECASIKREHHVKTVDFDHVKIKKLYNKYNNKTLPLVVKEIARNHQVAFTRLVNLRKITLDWRSERNGMFNQCTKSAVRFDAAATVGLSLMQITRDVGVAAIAIVGMPAGGVVALSAVAVTTAGSALCKYQDTGNFEAALVAGTGTLVMCGAGAVTSIYRAGATGVDAGGKVLIGMGIMLDATFEFGGAAVEGKTSKQACVSAVIKGMLGLGNAKLDQIVDTSKVGKAVSDQIEGLEKVLKDLSIGDLSKKALNSSQIKALGGQVALEMSKKSVEKTAMDYRPGGRKASRRPALSSDVHVYVHNDVLTIH